MDSRSSCNAGYKLLEAGLPHKQMVSWFESNPCNILIGSMKMKENRDCMVVNESINTLVLDFRDKYFTYDDGSKAEIESIDWREDELSYNFQI